MELGRISAIFRYPVKSMAGELLDVAMLSWHGIEGDRRLAFPTLPSYSRRTFVRRTGKSTNSEATNYGRNFRAGMALMSN